MEEEKKSVSKGKKGKTGIQKAKVAPRGGSMAAMMR
jgi:hypothetical protein